MTEQNLPNPDLLQSGPVTPVAELLPKVQELLKETTNDRTTTRTVAQPNQRGEVNATPPTETAPEHAPLPAGVLADTGVGSVGVCTAGGEQDCAVNTPKITPANTLELPRSEAIDSQEDNFRYELEFLEQKAGVFVKLRERARFTFDGKRPSTILGVFACGKLTKRQLTALRAKTLPPGVKEALKQGDIAYEVLEAIFKRPGKGATRAARKAGQAFRQNQA